MLHDLHALTNPYSQRLKQASQSRHQALEKAFHNPLVALTSLMGPINDGPEWPSDAGWLALGSEDSVRIISDGLSDPWVEKDRPPTGFGLEVYVKSEQLSQVDPGSLSDTWMFPMVAEISHTLAAYPRLGEKLCRGEPLSMQLNIDHLKDGVGLRGVLLHAPQNDIAEISNDFGNIQLIGTTLLTPTEYRWLSGKGLEGRSQLKESLIQAGIDGIVITERASVI